MRKHSTIFAVWIILLFLAGSTYADQMKCIACHANLKSGFIPAQEPHGDIYRLVETPCAALTSIRQETYFTESLLITTQRLLDNLSKEQHIEIDYLQKQLNSQRDRYRGLQVSAFHSAADYLQNNVDIRFNIHKVYKVAAGYIQNFRGRSAFGLIMIGAVLIFIFMIQGFKLAAGSPYVEKASSFILVLFILGLLPLFTAALAADEEAKPTYLDQLAAALEPLKDIPERVSGLVEIAYQISSYDEENAEKILAQSRQLWDNGQQKLNNQVIPRLAKPDKTGWVDSDQDRYDKILSSAQEILAPWVLRDLVMAEILAGAKDAEAKIQALREQIAKIQDPYTRFSYEASAAATIAQVRPELAKEWIDAIPQLPAVLPPFFRALAYTEAAKRMPEPKAGWVAISALKQASDITDPRWRTEMLLKIYSELSSKLPPLKAEDWSKIKKDFSLGGSGEADAFWQARLVERLAPKYLELAREVAQRISPDYPEPVTAVYLALARNGHLDSIRKAAQSVLQIQEAQDRNDLLGQIVAFMAEKGWNEAADLVKSINDSLYYEPALAAVIKLDYFKDPEGNDKIIAGMKDLYVRAILKADLAIRLAEKEKLGAAKEMLEAASGDANGCSDITPQVEVILSWAQVDLDRALKEARKLSEASARSEVLYHLSGLLKAKRPDLCAILLEEAALAVSEDDKSSPLERVNTLIKIAHSYGLEYPATAVFVMKKAVEILL